MKKESWQESVAYYAPYIPLMMSDRFIRPPISMSLFNKRVRSWLFWVNILFFQWYFIRLAREIDLDKKTVGFVLIGVMVPLTGWNNDYWYLWHIKNIRIKRYKEPR